MARIPERKFDPSKPIYARKAFTANGNKIAGGQQFDWKKLAVAQRRVLQMFEAGYLYHADSKPVNVTVEDKTTVKLALSRLMLPSRIRLKNWLIWVRSGMRSRLATNSTPLTT